MQGLGSISTVAALMLINAGCTSSSLPTLPPPPEARADPAQAPVEVVSIVPGTPTDVYALVARGALRCWFGPEGPLKQTHVFYAEAESPAKGGTAEIVVHERDETMRDKRGARAFQVGFSTEPAGVRVVVALPKVETQLGQAMAKDVAAWMKGGTECEVRRQHPSAGRASAGGTHESAAGRKR